MPRKKKVKYDEDGCPDVNIVESEDKDGDRYETRQHTQQKVRSVTINPPTYDFNNGNQEVEVKPQRPKKPKPGVRQIYPRPPKKEERPPLQVSDNHLKDAIEKDLRRRGVRNYPTDY